MDAVTTIAVAVISAALGGLGLEVYKRRGGKKDELSILAKDTGIAEIVDREHFSTQLWEINRELMKAEREMSTERVAVNLKISDLEREKDRIEQRLKDQGVELEEQKEEVLLRDRQLATKQADEIVLQAEIERLGREIVRLEREARTIPSITKVEEAI